MAKRSILEDHLDIVGTLPDAEVATRVGVTAENVRAFRNRRKIPAGWRVRKAKQGPSTTTRRRRRSRLDPFHSELGLVPDQDIAEKAGVSLSNVRQYRYRHGIKLQRPGDARTAETVEEFLATSQETEQAAPEETPQVPTSAPAAPTSGRWAFRVVVGLDGGETRDYVLFGADMAAAAATATARAGELHPGAQLREMSLIAESL